MFLPRLKTAPPGGSSEEGPFWRLNPAPRDLTVPQSPDTAPPSATSQRPRGPADLPSPCFHTRKGDKNICVTHQKRLLSSSPLTNGHLLLQPVVVLHDARHDHVSTFHVEGYLPRRFVLERKNLLLEISSRFVHEFFFLCFHSTF